MSLLFFEILVSFSWRTLHTYFLNIMSAILYCQRIVTASVCCMYDQKVHFPFACALYCSLGMASREIQERAMDMWRWAPFALLKDAVSTPPLAICLRHVVVFNANAFSESVCTH